MGSARGGDELGAVRERRLDLDLGEHLGHAFHHVVPAEHVAPGLHQVGHGAPVARPFSTQSVSTATASG